MSVDLDVVAWCDCCGERVYEHDMRVLCPDCYKNFENSGESWYHLESLGKFYCHKEKAEMRIDDDGDRIQFCPFCGEKVVG